MLLRHSIDGVTYQFDGLKELLAKATAARSPRWLDAGGSVSLGGAEILQASCAGVHDGGVCTAEPVAARSMF